MAGVPVFGYNSQGLFTETSNQAKPGGPGTGSTNPYWNALNTQGQGIPVPYYQIPGQNSPVTIETWGDTATGTTGMASVFTGQTIDVSPPGASAAPPAQSGEPGSERDITSQGFTLFTDASMAWNPDTMNYLASVGLSGTGAMTTGQGGNSIGTPAAEGLDYVIYDEATGKYIYPSNVTYTGGASLAPQVPGTDVGATPNAGVSNTNNSPILAPASTYSSATYVVPGMAGNLLGGNGSGTMNGVNTDITKKGQQGGFANSGSSIQGLGNTLLSSDNVLLKQLIGS